MSNKEISDTFDTLVGAYSPHGRIVFNEYEKSVFLTNYQDELLLGLYTGRGNTEAFEGSEELRRYLQQLIKKDLGHETFSFEEIKVASNSQIYILPTDLWFIVYESVVLFDTPDTCNKVTTVVPCTYDEYHRIKNNPFRGSNKRRVLRLDAGKNMVELVSDNKIESYKIGYLTEPSPIILEDLEGVKIKNKSTYTECTLHSALIKPLIEGAVKLALTSRGININNQG